MPSSIATTSIALLLFGGTALAQRTEQAARPGQFAPALLPEVQDAIRRTVHGDDPAARERALGELREQARADGEAFVQQLFLYSKDAGSTRDAMAFGALVDQLSIPDTQVVGAMVPLLESRDPGFLRSVHGILSEFEHAELDRPPSFAAYRPHLQAPMQRSDAPPAGLVRYLFEREPGTALVLITRLSDPAPEELAEILLAEHEIADVLWRRRHGFLPAESVASATRGQVGALAASRRWFARLYVAELCAQQPAVGSTEVLARLAEDRHALVRERAREARAKRAEPAPADVPRRR